MLRKKTHVHTVYLLLGSNLGDPSGHLATARQLIQKQIGPITRSSSLYQTAAWGKTDQPDFINQVIIAETTLSAVACMQICLDIERSMGRVRTEKNAARVIDIDVLYFDKAIINLPELEIPHPRIGQRRFVLVPLNELSPRFMAPDSGKTIHDMLLACDDRLDVKKI